MLAEHPRPEIYWPCDVDVLALQLLILSVDLEDPDSDEDEDQPEAPDAMPPEEFFSWGDGSR